MSGIFTLEIIAAIIGIAAILSVFGTILVLIGAYILDKHKLQIKQWYAKYIQRKED